MKLFRFLLFTALILSLFALAAELPLTSAVSPSPPSYILFTSSTYGPSSSLYRTDSLGRQPRQIEGVAEVVRSRFIYDAACSPNGEFSFSAGGMTWHAAFDGSRVSLLTAVDNVHYLSWSPDGSQIAGYHPIGPPEYNRLNIVSFPVAGETVDNLAAFGFGVNDVAWSPQGDRIAVSVYDAAGNWSTIRQITPSGGRSDTLVEMRGQIRDIAWSPNADALAFTMTRNGTDIYTIRADGSGMAQLTSAAGYDGFPQWSPDGRFISFSSNRDGRGFQIYLMSADGSSQRRITGRDFDYSDNLNRCWLIPPPTAVEPPLTESDGAA